LGFGQVKDVQTQTCMHGHNMDIIKQLRLSTTMHPAATLRIGLTDLTNPNATNIKQIL
jgi:hypothetical protein